MNSPNREEVFQFEMKGLHIKAIVAGDRPIHLDIEINNTAGENNYMLSTRSQKLAAIIDNHLKNEGHDLTYVNRDFEFGKGFISRFHFFVEDNATTGTEARRSHRRYIHPGFAIDDIKEVLEKVKKEAEKEAGTADSASSKADFDLGSVLDRIALEIKQKSRKEEHIPTQAELAQRKKIYLTTQQVSLSIMRALEKHLENYFYMRPAASKYIGKRDEIIHTSIVNALAEADKESVGFGRLPDKMFRAAIRKGLDDGLETLQINPDAAEDQTLKEAVVGSIFTEIRTEKQRMARETER